MTDDNDIDLDQMIDEFNSSSDDDRATMPESLRERDDKATELANVKEWFRVYHDDFRYDVDRGRWRFWDGKRWALDTTGEITRSVMQVAESTGDRLGEFTDPKDLKRFVTRAESSQGISGVKTLAKDMPGISITSDQFDADPMAINVDNGTIDLRNGSLRPHRRDDLNTIVLSVSYDPAAAAPMWEGFLTRIMAGNANLIGFLQRIMGAALTGQANDQTLPIFHGEGNNGKGVFCDTFVTMLGEYACVAPEALLIVKGNSEHPTLIANLRGKRFVVASESEAGATLHINQIKKLTGDLVLTGRFMRGDYFEFQRTWTIVFQTNNKPRLPEDSEAVWRRLRLIPFGVIVPEAERDPELINKLKAEWPGILAWAVRGCLELLRTGMNPPAEVKAATAEYRADADELADFIAAKCIVLGDGETGRTSRAELLAAYMSWCKETSERKPLSKPELFAAIRRRPGIVEKPAGWKVPGSSVPIRGFIGITLAGSNGMEVADERY